jgi:hypothetical protein
MRKGGFSGMSVALGMERVTGGFEEIFGRVPADHLTFLCIAGEDEPDPGGRLITDVNRVEVEQAHDADFTEGITPALPEHDEIVSGPRVSVVDEAEVRVWCQLVAPEDEHLRDPAPIGDRVGHNAPRAACDDIPGGRVLLKEGEILSLALAVDILGRPRRHGPDETEEEEGYDGCGEYLHVRNTSPYFIVLRKDLKNLVPEISRYPGT